MIAEQEIEQSDVGTVVTERITFRRRHGNGIAGTIERRRADGGLEVGFVDWTDLDVETQKDEALTYYNYIGKQPVAFLQLEAKEHRISAQPMARGGSAHDV